MGIFIYSYIFLYKYSKVRTKKMKKIIKVILFLILLAFVLPSQLAVAKSDVESIQKKGKLVLGTSAQFPPFEWVELVDGKETIVGVDIELAQKVAEELGVELEIQNMSFDTLIQSVKNGRMDIAMAGISKTKERAKQVDFSIPYYESGTDIVVPAGKEGTITKPEDLAKLRIGVQKGTIQEIYLVENGLNTNLTSMPKNDVLIETMKAGKLDVVVIDSVSADEFLRLNEGVITEISDVIPKDEEGGYSIVVGKGNDSLLEVINKVIEEAVEKDEINKSVEKNLELAAN
ncbi:amino acid ABC transporter ATP-binding protein [Dolosicoccus paucivorans]|nr:amino acid ABC transporter ATP-binding protein [Dolosicoccus paucivorans]